jgi:hypothetical protein
MNTIRLCWGQPPTARNPSREPDQAGKAAEAPGEEPSPPRQVYDLGFVARSALEEDDSGELRFSKIERIVEQCKFGIHETGGGLL